MKCGVEFIANKLRKNGDVIAYVLGSCEHGMLLKRLARKTICYSKSPEMHKIMLGLLINQIESHRQLF